MTKPVYREVSIIARDGELLPEDIDYKHQLGMNLATGQLYQATGEADEDLEWSELVLAGDPVETQKPITDVSDWNETVIDGLAVGYLYRDTNTGEIWAKVGPGTELTVKVYDPPA